MNKKFFIFGGVAIAVITIGVIIFFGFFNQRGSGPEQGMPPGCDLSSGEWAPQQGECQNNQSLQNQCNEFCSNHPECCPGWSANYTSSQGGPGQTILPLPSESEINSLTRNYVTIIKAIDEGPLIYQTLATQEIISDDELEKMKETGFNTVQVLLVGQWDGDELVFNDVNNAALLNDIVAIKKKGMAVWIALDSGLGNPNSENIFDGSYENYKSAFMDFVTISFELMEKYKVEYLTVNNEEDMFFSFQNNWGDASQINNNLIDFFPATNKLAKEIFNGKLINKMTQPRERTEEFLSATFKNVDIAGVDVGPFLGETTSLSDYKEQFNDYQFYATKAAAAGVPWMNAEYWLANFGEATNYQKNNQLEYATIPFDYYTNTIPEGAGYTYNEFASFSWEPQGEQTRLAMKDFLEKI